MAQGSWVKVEKDVHLLNAEGRAHLLDFLEHPN
jgi:hypothetical protein